MTIAKAIEELERLKRPADNWDDLCTQWVAQHGPTVLAALRAQGEPVATLRLTELLREAANALEAIHSANVDLLNRRLAPRAVPEGYVLVPVEPTAEMLSVITYDKFPEDWEVGKEAQRRLGCEVIYPKTEVEIAYGQYRRLLAAAKEGSNG